MRPSRREEGDEGSMRPPTPREGSMRPPTPRSNSIGAARSPARRSSYDDSSLLRSGEHAIVARLVCPIANSFLTHLVYLRASGDELDVGAESVARLPPGGVFGDG
jgi:hypothetical protein